MLSLFVTIAGLVVIVNIIYIIVPSEKYEQYCKVIVGLITVISVINVFINNGDFAFDFNFDSGTYQTQNDVGGIYNSLIESEVENRILSYLNDECEENVTSLNVTFNDDKVEKIEIEIPDLGKANEIKNSVAVYCDINPDKVVVK